MANETPTPPSTPPGAATPQSPSPAPTTSTPAGAPPKPSQSSTPPSAAPRPAAGAPSAAAPRTAEQSGQAREAARSVAEAVKAVADAAVRAVEQHPGSRAPQGDFTFVGSPGGKFHIESAAGNLGSSGTVVADGVGALQTTSWSVHRIDGNMPSGIADGATVTVLVDNSTRRTGTYRA